MSFKIALCTSCFISMCCPRLIISKYDPLEKKKVAYSCSKCTTKA